MSQHITQNYRHSATRCSKATFVSDLLLLQYEYFIWVVSSIAVAYFIFLCKTMHTVTFIRLDESVISLSPSQTLCPSRIVRQLTHAKDVVNKQTNG